MLSATGLFAMLAGVFTVGAGVFGWEFLLSDGRYDYGWVTSLGRSGARALLSAVGAGLIVFGFLARVLAVAGQPLAPEAALDSMQLADSSDAVGRSPRPQTERPAARADDALAPAGANRTPTNRNPANRNPTSRAAESNRAAADTSATSGTPATLGTPAAPPAAQLVTLWNPMTELEGEAGTFVTLSYRFEHGVRPQPGETYVWAIELPGGTQELEYEGESLSEQGELRRLVGVNLVDVPTEWRTWLTREKPSPPRRVSNRLSMVPRRAVRSEPAE